MIAISDSCTNILFCRVTIDVTPSLYTKTVKYFRILIAKPKSHRKGVLNRHEYNNILTTIFAT